MPDNRHGTHSSQEWLARYWDGVMRGQLPSDAVIDAELSATLRHFHEIASRDPGRGPDPRFVERLQEELMATASTPFQAPHDLAVGRIATPNGSEAWPLPRPIPRIPALRSRWALGHLATAALLLLTLVASYFAFGAGRDSRRSDQPAIIPAVSGTPATPEAAATRVADFLWQSDGGPDFPFGEPSHLTVDPEGRIWLPDGLEHRFLIFAPDGTLVDTWGASGSGEGEFTFDQSGVPAGAVAFDDAGNIYVVDSGNNRIQKFGPDRSFIAAWGNEGSGDGQLQFPVDVVVDGQGRVMVSDYGAATIQVFDADGRWLATWGGRGSDPGELSGPTGITLDGAGNLWVADHGGGRVQRFSPDGESQLIWGSGGDVRQAFISPTDVAVDAEGRVFVSDRSNRVQVFSAAGGLVGSWGGPGVEPGQFNGPFGLALDGQGNAYVAEDSGRRLQAFRLLPPLVPSLAVAAPDALAPPEVAEVVWTLDGGPDLPFDDPTALAFDPEGNLWVPDGGNDRFQIFTPDGEFIEAWGKSGDGDGEFNFSLSGYGYGAVVWDTDGNIYVADSGSYRIQKFAPDRTFLAAWGSRGTGDGQFLGLNNLAIDRDGRLHATDHERDDIQVFATDGRFLGAWGEPGLGEGQLLNPGSVTEDEAGNLYVNEYANHRIQKFSPDGVSLMTFGGNGKEDGQFTNPTDVALDASGRIFVADYGNSRIQVFDRDGQFLTAFGTFGFDAGQFVNPIFIVLDGEGFIYVSDESSDRVQKFRLLPPLDG